MLNWRTQKCSGAGTRFLTSSSTLNQGEANIVLIINVFAPGVGTIIAGCLGTHGGTAICIGLLQLLLFPVIIGWIWALIWSLALRREAKHGKREAREADVERGTKAPSGSSEPKRHHHGPHEQVKKPAPAHHDHVQQGKAPEEYIPPPPNPYDSHPPQVPQPPPSAPPMY
ncbi:SPEC3/Stum [Gracilaria domingensis]|nr:SPEC3/Stum [Gracilaria domingensis]